MCLRWIARQPQGSLGRVLDYGCGSGILAIGAAKFGAQDIDAVDIDADAVTSCQLNAQANQVQLKAGLPDQASRASTKPCWPIFWPRRSRCWPRCWPTVCRRAAIWCWREFWSARPQS